MCDIKTIFSGSDARCQRPAGPAGELHRPSRLRVAAETYYAGYYVACNQSAACASLAYILKEIMARLEKIKATVFSPDRGGRNPLGLHPSDGKAL